MKTLSRCALLSPAFAALLLLSGCGGGDKMQDLHDWTTHVKARPGPKIPPIPEMARYRAYSYPATNTRSPFVAVNAPVATGVQPNRHRQKQYLEQFPLDSLKFVGEITIGGAAYALIQDPQGIVHRVSAGDYLGQNNGRITAVLSNALKLTEIVPNGTGGYQRRSASLTLAQQPGG
ncbi:MAG: pilus assembly protein PilP [Gammaproteobacteria bacterium]